MGPACDAQKAAERAAARSPVAARTPQPPVRPLQPAWQTRGTLTTKLEGPNGPTDADARLPTARQTAHARRHARSQTQRIAHITIRQRSELIHSGHESQSLVLIPLLVPAALEASDRRFCEGTRRFCRHLECQTLSPCFQGCWSAALWPGSHRL